VTWALLSGGRQYTTPSARPAPGPEPPGGLRQHCRYATPWGGPKRTLLTPVALVAPRGQRAAAFRLK
jgi:hypothetical protein